MTHDLLTGNQFTGFRHLDVQAIFRRSDWALLDGEVSKVEGSLFRWFDQFGPLMEDEIRSRTQSGDMILGGEYQGAFQIPGVGTETITLSIVGMDLVQLCFEAWTTITRQGSQEVVFHALYDFDFALFEISVSDDSATEKLVQVLDSGPDWVYGTIGKPYKPVSKKKVRKKKVRLGNSATLDDFWAD